MVKKQKLFPGVRGTGAHYLTFTPDSARLIVASTDSQVVVMDISQWEAGQYDVLRRFGQHRGTSAKDTESMDVDGEQDHAGAAGQVETIVSMAVSADGLWLATGDLLNRIFIFNLDTLQVRGNFLRDVSRVQLRRIWSNASHFLFFFSWYLSITPLFQNSTLP
jgi:U3 small nucleolar RNA-associated protein 4